MHVVVWEMTVNSELVQDKALLLHECEIHGVIFRLSSIGLGNAGIGCFTSQDFCKGEPDENYNGTLVYKNIVSSREDEVYGKLMIAVLSQEVRRNLFQPCK